MGHSTGMSRQSRRPLLLAALAVALVTATIVGGLAFWRTPAAWGAAAIPYPLRRPVTVVPRLPFEAVSFSSGSERRECWLFRADGERRGLVVYLHGIADNRQSGIGVAERLVPLATTSSASTPAPTGVRAAAPARMGISSGKT